MDQNDGNNDDVNGSLSPKSGGKKIKLNDGSSQDSSKEEEPVEKDENVDSGVSGDKCESTSSDDRCVTNEGPSNEVVTIAPSSSNVRAILRSIMTPKKGRNYRKRKTPGRDSDSDSSQDSDDLSENEETRSSSTESNLDPGNDELQRILMGHNDSDGESLAYSYVHSTSEEEDQSVSNDSDVDIHMSSSDSDSDVELWGSNNDDEEHSRRGSEDNTQATEKPAVLQKSRPSHEYSILKEIVNRELGLTTPVGKTYKNEVVFQNKFYSSLHAVYRLQKLHRLNKHKGCVNSINFHPEGKLLASGSDDTNVIVWEWARNKPLMTLKTGHKSNVFQSKFLYLNAESELNIVTCARDGQVRLITCAGDGSLVCRRRLGVHSRSAHKVHVAPSRPHDVLSAAEDGLVLHVDLRSYGTAHTLIRVKEEKMVIPLYSIHGHPRDDNYVTVAGSDRFVRVYDRRKPDKPTALYSPSTFRDVNVNSSKRKLRTSSVHLTCAVYNHDGTEILASYNDEDIYLFNTHTDVYDKEIEKEGYTHRYSGHRNSATFKGVAFYGPNSEYVVSGSDCSNIFIWDKKTEAIVQWMPGDDGGVVNCIESHPSWPVLATSGLDKDVKIWTPSCDHDPNYEGLEKAVRSNSLRSHRRPLFNDFLPTLFSAWSAENNLYSDDSNDAPRHSNSDMDENICTLF